MTGCWSMRIRRYASDGIRPLRNTNRTVRRRQGGLVRHWEGWEGSASGHSVPCRAASQKPPGDGAPVAY